MSPCAECPIHVKLLEMRGKVNRENYYEFRTGKNRWECQKCNKPWLYAMGIHDDSMSGRHCSTSDPVSTLGVPSAMKGMLTL